MKGACRHHPAVNTLIPFSPFTTTLEAATVPYRSLIVHTTTTTCTFYHTQQSPHQRVNEKKLHFIHFYLNAQHNSGPTNVMCACVSFLPLPTYIHTYKEVHTEREEERRREKSDNWHTMKFPWWNYKFPPNSHEQIDWEN